MSKNNLKIYGESVQTIYDYFNKKKLIVNRQYQRKLVWTIEEKKSFIDSIIKGYPIPLILFAETKEQSFEIIDGMQRLNAIVSFIEGEFSVGDNNDEKYFDLDTMATSKLLKDENKLVQKTPLLSREICVNFANYVLPISTHKETGEIDEIFRRINSGGKKLSNQELRQAGIISKFNNLVRKVSSEIRGDVSSSDKLVLNKMKEISLNSQKLEYGINTEDIFWVKHNIIEKSKIRDSKDEEIIADILSFIILNEPQTISSKILNDFYDPKSSKYKSLEETLRNRDKDEILKNFKRVYDEIDKILTESEEKTFSKLFFSTSKKNISRYYIVFFFAMYELICYENLEIKNYEKMTKDLKNLGEGSIPLSSGGGTWSQKEKINAKNAIKGILKSNFKKSKRSKEDDIAYQDWALELENIFTITKTEQAFLDFKQGFYNLENKKFDDGVLEKVLKTLTAMANTKKNSVGYVLIGIMDNKSDVEKIKSKFYGIDIIQEKKSGFYIKGIQKEAEIEYQNLDIYWKRITQKINDSNKIDLDTKNLVLNNMKLINYKGKSILKFEIKSQGKPLLYDNKYYDRNGTSVREVPTQEILNLAERLK